MLEERAGGGAEVGLAEGECGVLGALTFLWWRVTAAHRRQRGQLTRMG